MSALLTTVSVISILAFSAACVGALRRAYLTRHTPGAVAAMAFAAAMALYALVSLSNALQAAHISEVFHPYEDYSEILFTPLLLFTLFTAQSAAEIRRRSQNAFMLKSQNDLLMSIVDTSPSGIMIVAPGGHITFANDAARNMLDLAENPDTGRFEQPRWELHDSDGRSATLADLATTAASGVRHSILWPDGSRGELLFTVTPMSDATNAVGGALLAIEQASAHT